MPKALHAGAMQIRRFDPATDTLLLSGLVALLVEAVRGGASIGFMASISGEEALAFWRARIAAAAHGDVVLLIAIEGESIAGTVSLLPATPPNQPHRADIGKMIVAQARQRQGLGMALMTAIEAEARGLGRTTLVLDTISGSAAAHLYARCGWERIGEIRDYALMPDGVMAPTTVYSKHLQPPLRG